MPNNIEFRDSCGHFDTLRYTTAWYDVTANGRGSPAGYAYDQNGGTMRFNVSAEQDKVLAMAWKMNSVNKPYYMSFVESGTQHVTVGVDSTTGKLAAWRGGYGGTLLAKSTTQLFFNGDYPHCEVKCNVHDTTGSIAARVNNIPVVWDAAVTNIDTRNGGTGVINALWFGVAGDHGWTCDIVSQFSGSDWVGDTRVLLKAANAAGTYTDGVATGSGTRLACVQTFDNDTTYILQDATGLPKKVSFTMAALPANTATVIDVAPVWLARKDDAGTDNVRGIVKSGATEQDGGVDVAALAGYSDIFGEGAGKRHYQTDPNTSAAWTIANVNALEIGRSRVA